MKKEGLWAQYVFENQIAQPEYKAREHYDILVVVCHLRIEFGEILIFAFLVFNIVWVFNSYKVIIGLFYFLRDEITSIFFDKKTKKRYNRMEKLREIFFSIVRV